MASRLSMPGYRSRIPARANWRMLPGPGEGKFLGWRHWLKPSDTHRLNGAIRVGLPLSHVHAIIPISVLGA
jgi:hypothetical protein